MFSSSTMLSQRTAPCGRTLDKVRYVSFSHARSPPLNRWGAARVETAQRSVLARAGAPVGDRVLGSLPYLSPLFDGLRYGKFLFLQFPIFQKLLAPLNPLLSLYFQIPFASLVVFFAIYLGLVNNQNMSRNVRFNAMQAILLDILLIIPSVVERLFRPPLGGVGLDLYVVVYNTIFLYIFCSVAYGVGSCIAGSTARIPLVANAAEDQIRYR